MKKLIGLLVIMLSLITVEAFAADLFFTWRAANPPITGYKLYMDTSATPIQTIDPSVTTATVPAPEDGNPHNFWITAFYLEEESGRSAIVTWETLTSIREFRQVFQTVPN